MKYLFTGFILCASLAKETLQFGVRNPGFDKFPQEILRNAMPYQHHGNREDVPCDQVRLNSCMTQYYAHVGLSGPFKTARDLGEAIQRLVQTQGKQAWLRLCHGGSLLTQCLGADMELSCINPLTLLQMGLDLADAYGYYEIHQQMRFSCGGGLMVGLENFNCMNRTSMLQARPILKCYENFFNNMIKDPQHYCSYATDLMKCVWNIFETHCNQAAGWFECENVRISVSVSDPLERIFFCASKSTKQCSPDPLCKLRCNVGSPPSEEKTAESQARKAEDLKTLERDKRLLVEGPSNKNIQHLLDSRISHLQGIAQHAQATENKKEAKQ